MHILLGRSPTLGFPDQKWLNLVCQMSEELLDILIPSISLQEPSLRNVMFIVSVCYCLSLSLAGIHSRVSWNM